MTATNVTYLISVGHNCRIFSIALNNLGSLSFSACLQVEVWRRTSESKKISTPYIGLIIGAWVDGGAFALRIDRVVVPHD